MKVGKKLETKRYTYSQLKDQQNILMLMAKKNTIMSEEDDETKTLEYFLEIFDGITRLAELYLKLLRNGCILFNKFEAVVYCDILNDREKMSKPVSMSIELLLKLLTGCDENIEMEIEASEAKTSSKNFKILGMIS